MFSTSPSPADHDSSALQDRARRRRQRFTSSILAAPTLHTAGLRTSAVRDRLRSIPLRYTLHLVVALVVPLAALLSASPMTFGSLAPQSSTSTTTPALLSDFTVPLAPLSLDKHDAQEAAIPDSAFAAIDALPVSPLVPQLMEVRPVPATIAAEIANVRGGPGTEYDKVTTLPAGAALQLVARYDDWYKAQADGGQVVWVAAELLDTDIFAAEFLPEATSIPAPPPPKVAQVFEEGVNLRDGPSTSYVGMTKLSAGMRLDLVSRYEDWYQVQTPEGQIGWVTSQFLAIGPGITERVEVISQIPDPNPALVALVREAQVNLRGGPGTAYNKLGALGADVQLDLMARYKDWFKVRTPRGTEGWVSSELVQVSPYVARRVPQARSVPALPQAAARSRPSAGIRGPVQFAPASATSGPVQFALQFIGARYTWGGASPKTGFDCSGFIKYVYAQFGVSLPHGSVAQYSTRYGTAISNPGDLLPGDIVFFVNTYRRGISHVGIYVGDGNVVQALTPGRGVGIANMGERYWSSRYYGAIRPGR
jgi:cell wall-associated NlpC family hydrolase